MTTQHIDDAIEFQAQQLAQRTLANADSTLDWRDAGYASALDAAKALIGDGEDDDVVARAAEIVAAEIE